MAQKDKQEQEHQDHAAGQDLEDGLDRDVDQVGAVIEGLDLDAGREASVVQLLDLLSHPLQRRNGLRLALQQDDAFQHVIALVDPHLAQPHAIADGDLPYILDIDRRARLLRHDNVFDVAQVPDQADAADVEALGADRQIVPPDVRVAVGQGVQHLPQHDVVLGEASRVHIHMVFLRRATERRHIDDSADLLELALQLPVLDRLQVAEREFRRTH